MEKTVKRICQNKNCGKVFYIIPSRLKHGRGKSCSPECQYAAIKERRKETQPALYCLNCGNAFRRSRSRLTRHIGAGKYCCRACRDTHRNGKNHPQYIHGDRANWHGPNWQAQKRKAKRRDNWICQHCGMNTEQSIKEFGQVLHVHHKIPFRLFDSYLEANDLSNLITLCPTCHREAEAEFQRSERANQNPSPLAQPIPRQLSFF